MREVFENFLKTIKKREHIKKLTERLERLTIKFVFDLTPIEITFHLGEATLQDENSEKAICCEISGQPDSIIKLIFGEEQLRYLMMSGELKVKASFRTILLLESIFYLTKPEQQQRKLIS